MCYRGLMRTSDVLIKRNGNLIQRAGHCKFIRQVRTGSLSRDAAWNYVVLEAQFINEATRLIGAAVANAPDDRSLAEHSRAVIDLVEDQRPYLENVAKIIGPADGRIDSVDVPDHSLAGLASRIRYSGDYGYIVTLCFATEVFYLWWCTGALETLVDNTYLSEWVRMHTTVAFRRRVDFLSSEVDRLDVGEYSDYRLSALFEETIEAEVEFHDAVYDL